MSGSTAGVDSLSATRGLSAVSDLSVFDDDVGIHADRSPRYSLCDILSEVGVECFRSTGSDLRLQLGEGCEAGTLGRLRSVGFDRGDVFVPQRLYEAVIFTKDQRSCMTGWLKFGESNTLNPKAILERALQPGVSEVFSLLFAPDATTPPSRGDALPASAPER